MEEFNLIEKLERVKAPSDFEQRMLAQLSFRKRKNLRARQLRFSLAGALSAALALIVVLNIFFLLRKSPVEYAFTEKGAAEMEMREAVPIIEAVDYAGQMKSPSPELRTVYILEQVTPRTGIEIKY
jgi:hypothetical protein